MEDHNLESTQMEVSEATCRAIHVDASCLENQMRNLVAHPST